MKAKILTSVALLACSGSLFAQTLATVNGQKIDSSVIDAQVAAFRAENSRAEDTPQLRQSLLENEVVNTVVAQEVKRLKLDLSAEFKNALAKLRAEAKKSGDDKKPSLQNRLAGGKIWLERRGIRAAYRQNPAGFRAGSKSRI